jgi:hypothetical protein
MLATGCVNVTISGKGFALKLELTIQAFGLM